MMKIFKLDDWICYSSILKVILILIKMLLYFQNFYFKSSIELFTM